MRSSQICISHVCIQTFHYKVPYVMDSCQIAIESQFGFYVLRILRHKGGLSMCAHGTLPSTGACPCRTKSACVLEPSSTVH